MFTAKDLRFLQLALSRRKLVATPHLFTEVCNLASALPETTRLGFFGYLARFIPKCQEEIMRSVELAQSQTFRLFGIADAALALLATEYLVITEDGRLRDFLVRSNLQVLSLEEFQNAQSTSDTIDL